MFIIQRLAEVYRTKKSYLAIKATERSPRRSSALLMWLASWDLTGKESAGFAHDFSFGNCPSIFSISDSFSPTTNQAVSIS